jgi:rubrerythrin
VIRERDMTKEYREYSKSRIEYLLKRSNLDERDKEALEAAIQALSQEPTDTWSIKDVADTFKKHGLIREQEPCEDAISRILKRMWNCRGKHTTSIDKVKMEQIIRDELPSVTQKSGKWRRVSIEKYIQHAMAYYVCSECGGQTIGEPKFCPNCGAKMESEDKE